MDSALAENMVFGIPLQDLPSYSQKPRISSDEETVAEKKLNRKLLIEIMNFIEEHPRTWRQGSWYVHVDPETGLEKASLRVEEVSEVNSCGSSFCFAGHVALAEGFPSPPLDNHSDWVRDSPDGGELVDEFARKRLGLNHDQADYLFDGGNSLDDLKKLVALLLANENVSISLMSDVMFSDMTLEDAIMESYAS